MEERSNFLPNLTTIYGILLTLWGLIVTGISESQSISSFAPALFGLPLLVSGEMAKTPGASRKLWMHVAVTFGLLAALGVLGLRLLRAHRSSLSEEPRPVSAGACGAAGHQPTRARGSPPPPARRARRHRG